MRRKTGLADKISRPFLKFKELVSFPQFMGRDDFFSDCETERISDHYRSHSLVNIAVSTLMRNIWRASFRITRDGEFVTCGPVFEHFRDVNPVMNRFDLWKVSSATTKLLRNNAFPEGILKIDKVLRGEEADRLESYLAARKFWLL